MPAHVITEPNKIKYKLLILLDPAQYNLKTMIDSNMTVLSLCVHLKNVSYSFYSEMESKLKVKDIISYFD